MNYQKLYDSIVNDAKYKIVDIQKDYFETHHIIPRCLGGSDSEENLVSVTARQHFLLHWILTKLYPSNIKILYAFNNMCMYSANQTDRQYNSKAFQYARKIFVKNHPLKNNSIRTHHKEQCKKSMYKVFSSIIERYQRIGKPLVCLLPENYFIVAPCDVKRYVDGSPVLNQEKVFYNKAGKIFDPTTNWLLTLSDDEMNTYKGEQSRRLKSYLSKLTPEQLSMRSHNSFRKADEAKRAKAISIGKKGKKTKQREIMGRRFAAMSDIDFGYYLNTISVKMHKQYTNLREKWKIITMSELSQQKC